MTDQDQTIIKLAKRSPESAAAYWEGQFWSRYDEIDRIKKDKDRTIFSVQYELHEANRKLKILDSAIEKLNIVKDRLLTVYKEDSKAPYLVAIDSILNEYQK